MCRPRSAAPGPSSATCTSTPSTRRDASTQGTRATPIDAYRFARGEPLRIQPLDAEGRPQRRIQLDRPLDFTAVTDHAEQLGETFICRTPGLPGHDSWVCRLYRWWPRAAFYVMNAGYSFSRERWSWCGENGVQCLEAARDVWGRTQAAAEGAYDRTEACRFTSFVAYEWTANGGAARATSTATSSSATSASFPCRSRRWRRAPRDTSC